MKLRHAIVAAICGSALVFAAAPGAQAHVSRSANSASVPAFGNVFEIIGENTTFGELTKGSAPYIRETLAPKSAELSTYFGTTHNSTANYISLTSGQYKFCEQEDDHPDICHQSVDNLFSQLDAAGISWHEWMESANRPCDIGNHGSDPGLNEYRVKHNPAVYYGRVEGAKHHWSATDPSPECLANVVPAGGTGPNDTSALDSALASGDVPRFNLIVPNMCEDSHDNCPPFGPGNRRINQFDQFLAREVPKIESSPAFTANSAILVVWDEADAEGLSGDPQYGGGNVMWLMDSPLVTPGIYSGLSNHYSTLQMLEDANPIPAIWK